TAPTLAVEVSGIGKQLLKPRRKEHNMSTTTGLISQLQLVVIASTDLERSIAFYEALGFEKRADFPWADGHRWVELYPPGGTAGLALVPPRRGGATPAQTGGIPHT